MESRAGRGSCQDSRDGGMKHRCLLMFQTKLGQTELALRLHFQNPHGSSTCEKNLLVRESVRNVSTHMMVLLHAKPWQTGNEREREKERNEKKTRLSLSLFSKLFTPFTLSLSTTGGRRRCVSLPLQSSETERQKTN